MSPLVKEYLRFVPNREGQEGQRDGKDLPMTAEFAAEQRAKLEAGGKAARGEGSCRRGQARRAVGCLR